MTTIELRTSIAADLDQMNVEMLAAVVVGTTQAEAVDVGGEDFSGRR